MNEVLINELLELCVWNWLKMYIEHERERKKIEEKKMLHG